MLYYPIVYYNILQYIMYYVILQEALRHRPGLEQRGAAGGSAIDLASSDEEAGDVLHII